MLEVYHQVPPDYWDKSYNNNILQRVWYDLRFKAMRKILQRLPDGSNILDIGCGSGFSMEKSIPLGKTFEIHGVDVTEELINYAKENHFSQIKLEVIKSNPKAKELYQKLGFKTSKITQIPYPFSYIMGFDSFEEMHLNLMNNKNLIKN